MKIEPKVGVVYEIDKEYNHEDKPWLVELLWFGDIFCKVRNNLTGYTWETTLYRLTYKK